MLNGAGVVFPAMIAGAIGGVLAYSLTSSAAATGILSAVAAWMVGRYCYGLLK